ncbi:MAG: Gfo/Idh/MocA family oxidoreductase [Verrucomicrobiales bacterium]
MVEKHFAKDKESGNFKGCDTYNDFRELCARKDIDAVIVGTPDHWHALATVEALRNDKDVYCEKPITHLFAEGQVVYKLAAEKKRIFQVGSQQRRT